jgi:DNA repair exonuclease SbcCD ATPase subunit
MGMLRNSINEINSELEKISNSKFTAFITSKSTIANLNSDLKSLTNELNTLDSRVKRLNEKLINIKDSKAFVDDLHQAYLGKNSSRLSTSDFFSYLDNCQVIVQDANTNNTLIKNKYLKYKQKYLNLKNKIN